LVFRRKKKEEEIEDEDEDEEEGEDYDDEEDEVELEPPRSKTLPKLPHKRRRTVEAEDKFVAVHQPELVGIRNTETNEVKEFNVASEIAEIKSMLWDIQQKL